MTHNPYIRFRRTFDARLADFVRAQAKKSDVRGQGAVLLRRHAAEFALRPGKRLRPYLAFQTATVCGVSRGRALHLAIAMELFHAFALVHDDLLDHSDERRGRPTLHKVFEALHRRRRLLGSSSVFGEGMALLAGDLLFAWADAAVSKLTTGTRGTATGVRERRGATLSAAWNAMREEVILGQSTDVALGLERRPPAKRELQYMLIVKSGRYSFGRPILLGLALAGRRVADKRVLAAVEPLGLAFQLRDDLLGTFGNPHETGKPADSDIREGKMTLLAWETLRRLKTSGERMIWKRGFGKREARLRDVTAVRRLMVTSSAKKSVEVETRRLTETALRNITRLPFPSGWLAELAATLEERRK